MAEEARRHNFDLDKSVGLKDIDIQSEQLKADRSSGLRDIGTQRELGVEAAVNNALQRGIFRSGIRERNVGRVNERADEAEFDLRGDIDRALSRLSNQRRGVAGKKFIPAGGSGGLGGFFEDLLKIINDLGGFIDIPPIQPNLDGIGSGGRAINPMRPS